MTKLQKNIVNLNKAQNQLTQKETSVEHFDGSNEAYFKSSVIGDTGWQTVQTQWWTGKITDSPTKRHIESNVNAEFDLSNIITERKHLPDVTFVCMCRTPSSVTPVGGFHGIIETIQGDYLTDTTTTYSHDILEEVDDEGSPVWRVNSEADMIYLWCTQNNTNPDLPNISGFPMWDNSVSSYSTASFKSYDSYDYGNTSAGWVKLTNGYALSVSYNQIYSQSSTTPRLFYLGSGGSKRTATLTGGTPTYYYTVWVWNNENNHDLGGYYEDRADPCDPPTYELEYEGNGPDIGYWGTQYNPINDPVDIRIVVYYKTSLSAGERKEYQREQGFVL